MGGFMIQGLVPGPRFMEDHASLLYALFAVLLISNFFTLLIGSVFIRYVRRLTNIPRSTLYACILVFSILGSYEMCIRDRWWMDRFRSELRTEVCIRNQHDLFKSYEVENSIQCAAMSAVASKERKESRWGLWHMRSDYPVKDDAQWLKHIVLTQGDSLEDIRVSYAPVIKMEETA